jgi:hypothetical protein
MDAFHHAHIEEGLIRKAYLKITSIIVSSYYNNDGSGGDKYLVLEAYTYITIWSIIV